MPIPAPDLNNVYLLRLEGTLMGEPCCNVLAIADLTGTQTIEAVMTGIATAFNDEWDGDTGDAYRAVISNQRIYTNYHLVRYDQASPDVLDLGVSGSIAAGASTGHPLPPQISCVVSLTTGQASRRRRGRLYDYGFVEDSNDTTGKMAAGTRTAVINFWTGMLDEFNQEDLAWGVLSRGWINEGPGDTRSSYDQEFTVITSVAVRDNHWDTMRSRVPD